MTASAATSVAGRPRLWLAAMVLLAVSVIFGGASRENPLRLMLVEVASLPLLVLGVRATVLGGTARGLIAPLALLALIAAIPLLQLIPLPPELWTKLPGRAAEARALAVAGLAQPWLPASLAPTETLRSVLALLPPAAMLIGAAQLARPQWRIMAGVWIALGAASVALGAGQLIAAESSPFYLYETTNYGSVVGFFANRNHEATYLLALLPFAAAFAARGLSGGGARNLPAMLAMPFFLLAIVALAAVKSRAGVILVVPALLASIAVVWRSRAARGRARAMAAVAGLSVAAVVAVLLFGLAPLIERFDAPHDAEVRAQAWPFVQAAAQTLQPVGAGIGAFDRVYRSVEPLTLVSPFYFNHVHNDYLETWLEAGWLGAGAVILFGVWFGSVALQAWRRREGEDPDLARAASVAIALILAHSFVDYPLRTTTIATLFAFCCAVLAASAMRDGRDAH